MTRHWNTSLGLWVENSEILGRTAEAESFEVAVVAVVGTHLAAVSSRIQHISGLTHTLASAADAQVEAHTAGHADIFVEAH